MNIERKRTMKGPANWAEELHNMDGDQRLNHANDIPHSMRSTVKAIQRREKIYRKKQLMGRL